MDLESLQQLGQVYISFCRAAMVVGGWYHIIFAGGTKDAGDEEDERPVPVGVSRGHLTWVVSVCGMHTKS